MEPLITEAIAKRVQSVLTKIRSAEEKAGRSAGTVQLVAVTKTVAVEYLVEGVRAGLSILGKNRVQEALPKIAPSLRCRFTGILLDSCNEGRYGP